MEIYEYSHLGGGKTLPKQERTEITDALRQCETPVIRGRAAAIRNEILQQLSKHGWPGKVPISHASKISITSQKNKVGLCIQTGGNMSRMYADLIKLQQMYLDKKIEVGVLVLPTSPAARKLGDNLANSDRLEAELEIFKQVIHMPISVISFQ